MICAADGLIFEQEHLRSILPTEIINSDAATAVIFYNGMLPRLVINRAVILHGIFRCAGIDDDCGGIGGIHPAAYRIFFVGIGNIGGVYYYGHFIRLKFPKISLSPVITEDAEIHKRTLIPI